MRRGVSFLQMKEIWAWEEARLIACKVWYDMGFAATEIDRKRSFSRDND